MLVALVAVVPPAHGQSASASSRTVSGIVVDAATGEVIELEDTAPDLGRPATWEMEVDQIRTLPGAGNARPAPAARSASVSAARTSTGSCARRCPRRTDSCRATTTRRSGGTPATPRAAGSSACGCSRPTIAWPI
ncbi:MAG TPA: hypothetical protein VM734_13460, partial [Kofleriaceae bacterium]|nr:hypothetical protein [Kofleriaceae bacterium]